MDSTGAPHLELSADAIEDKSSETNQQAQHHDSPVDQESIQRHLDAFLGAKIAADLTTSQYSYQSDVPLLQDVRIIGVIYNAVGNMRRSLKKHKQNALPKNQL